MHWHKAGIHCLSNRTINLWSIYMESGVIDLQCGAEHTNVISCLCLAHGNGPSHLLWMSGRCTILHPIIGVIHA